MGRLRRQTLLWLGGLAWGLAALAFPQEGALPVREKLREPRLLGTPIQNASLVSYRLCPGYGRQGHTLLCWTTSAESGGHFCALDLHTDELDIKPLHHLEAYPIVPASDGAIYVGSTTGEIWRYRAEGSVWEVAGRPWDLSRYGVHHVRAMCEGRDGWLYCGSCYGERARVNKKTGEVQPLPDIPEKGNWYVSAVVPLPDGRIAFGLGHVARIYIYDPAQNKDVAQWAPESWKADGFIIAAAVGPNILYAKHFPSGRRGAFDLQTGAFLGEAPWPPDIAYPVWSRWRHNSAYGSVLDFYLLPASDAIATSDGRRVYLWHPKEGAHTLRLADFQPPAELALEMKYAVTADLQVLEYDEKRLQVRREKTYEQPRVERGLFGLGVGPDGCIYGGAFQSMHLFRYNPHTGELRDLGNHNPGWSGEIYSFCVRGKELVCASYTNGALVLYNPFRPWRCDYVKQINPRFVGCLGQYTYRPVACLAASDGRIWAVGPAGWGSTGGGVSWLDPETKKTGSTRLATVPFALAELQPGLLLICDAVALRWWDAARNQQIAEAPWPQSYAGAAVLLEAQPRRLLAYTEGKKLYFVRLLRPGRMLLQASLPMPVEASRLLWDGRRIIAGGPGGVAEYDPAAQVWTKLARLGPLSPFAFVATETDIYFTRGAQLFRLPRREP